MIWCGVLTMGVSLLTSMVALSRLEVSQAYPFTSLGIVLTILDGRRLFDELLSLGKIPDATLIVVGVVCVSRVSWRRQSDRNSRSGQVQQVQVTGTLTLKLEQLSGGRAGLGLGR
jgi:drug/metabolite transporter (DMT)-like permease